MHRQHTLWPLVLILAGGLMSVSSYGSTWRELLDRADTLYEQWEFDSAVVLTRLALESAVTQLGTDDTAVATVWLNLGRSCYYQGNLLEAESCTKKGLAMRQRLLGADHPEVARSLNNLAIIYMYWGRLADAERLYEQALEIQENKLEPDHPDLLPPLYNLAITCELRRDYARAQQLYERSLEIKEKRFGPGSRAIANQLVQLAHIHAARNEYTQAEALYREHIEGKEKARGPDHPWLCEALRGLANLYSVQNDFVMAESLLQRCLNIDGRTFGAYHVRVAQDLEPLSRLYRRNGRYEPALDSASRAVGIRHREFLDNARVLSERDALRFSRNLRHSTSNYLSCYADAGPAQRPSPLTVGDIIVATKGQVSEGLFERRRRLALEDDPAIRNLTEELRLLQRRLAQLHVSGFAPDTDRQRDSVETVTRVINELESELARLSVSFRRWQDYQNISVERIASLLPEKTVLVEYMQYNYLQLQPDSTIPHYLVVVIDGDGQPAITDLGESADIDRLISDYRSHMIRMTETAGLPSDEDLVTYHEIAGNLYARVWKPVEECISDQDLIFIAPDGGLNLISFATLIDENNRYLIEKVPIHYLSAGRDVVRLRDAIEPARGLFALGAPDYDASVDARLADLQQQTDSTPDTAVYGTMRGALPACDQFNLTDVSSLPLSRFEVEEIVRIWRATSDESVVVYFDAGASEDRFKAEASGHRVIHLATHGYFISAACYRQENTIVADRFIGDHPLLLSGLYLAGANRRSTGTDSAAIDDGILTAYELSSMDLAGTELVVLSACETGLGSVKEGEGVYGLRRAFQMAGARTVISSLWSVSDRQTATFMSKLYQRHQEPLPVRLRRLQLSRIDDLRSKGLSDHPVSWGAFIACGDWR